MAIWTPSVKTKTKKLKIEGCQHVYKVEVPPGRMQDALHNIFLRLQLRARIAGFRPGKAPLEMVKKQYGRDAAAEAAEEVLKTSIPEVLKELNLRPVAAPSVGAIQTPPNGPMSFELHVEVAPKFTPNGYQGIAVTRKDLQVADKDIEERLKQLQDGNARLEKTKGETVGKEHYAVLDYQMKRDGKPVEGGKGKQELIDMSSEQTIEGLTKNLLGAKRGETRTFEIKVDGKATECTATVSEIKVKILPKIDEEFAKDMGVDSLAKLREELKKLIERENSEQTERELSKQIEEALLKANNFSVPASLTEHQTEHMIARLASRIGRRDGKLPEKEAEELRKTLKPQAEQQVKIQFILAAIGEKEKIDATDEDFKSEFETAVEKAKGEENKKKAREFFEKSKDDVLSAIRERKVIRLIRDSAKIKTVPA